MLQSFVSKQKHQNNVDKIQLGLEKLQCAKKQQQNLERIDREKAHINDAMPFRDMY